MRQNSSTPPQRPGAPEQFRATGNWVLFTAQALSVTVEVFLHNPGTFGVRYLGLQVGFAVLLLFFYPALWPRHDTGAIWQYLGAFVVMAIVVRCSALASQRRGRAQPHSRYSGTPLVMRLLRGISEERVKGVVEPVLVWLVAALTTSASEPLAMYLFLAGTGLAVSVNLLLARERTRVLDMNDAFLEQKRMADRWRNMRQD